MPAHGDVLAQLFVNRDTEIEQVEKAIQEVEKNKKGRALHLLGERGSGKTWLMQYLHRVKLKEITPYLKPSLYPFYIDFSFKLTSDEEDNLCVNRLPKLELSEKKREFYFGQDEDNEQALLNLMKHIADKLDITHFSDSTLADLSQRLRDGIERKWKKENIVIVFLLDDVYTRSESLLDLIETHLLKPLLQLPVLILLSGRGSPFDWISAELRLYAKTLHLQAFDKRTMREQIERYFQYLGLNEEDYAGILDDYLDEIHQVSAGYPYASLYLAIQLQEGKSISEVLDQLIDCLFGFIQDPAERKNVINHVEALSVLNPWEIEDEISKNRWGFRINAIRRFLNAYNKCSGNYVEEIDGSEAMDIFQGLTTLRIVRWESGVGYYIDQALRFPIVARLKEKKPSLWRCLHEYAHDYFANRNEEIAEKHKAVLKKLGEKKTKPVQP